MRVGTLFVLLSTQCPVHIQFSHSIVFDSLQPHGLQHTRLPCPSSTPRAYSHSCPSYQWCHPTISSSVIPSPTAFNLSQHCTFSSDQSLSHVRLFATPWIAAHQASLSITNSWSLLKHMSIESVMPSNHHILCHPLLLLLPIPPSIKVFFQWVNSSHEVAKVLEFQLQHQSFQWIFRTDLL